MYSIGQVSAMTNLPISTLRYYDKEGFFPNLEKQSGIRRFSQAELDAIRMIEYLKRSGLEIKDIRQFFEWVEEGPSTYPNRKAMFEARKKAVEEEMKQLEKKPGYAEIQMLVLRKGHGGRQRRRNSRHASG